MLRQARVVERVQGVGHMLGTTTAWPAARSEPGDLHQPVGVVEQSERDRDQMVDPTCADDLYGVATAGLGHQRGHRHHQGTAARWRW